ncbi:Yip1 domain family protein [Coprinopsis cinerea okayama7|uniref:Protein YIP n=1 Tax=Coprinopsis cinerea (strain Okayama-7 / 130 / ATCC MYA-4618 / FGSC 9003) TaxID=240176 RepID=A8P0P5_COPC7|nr:Yip1 domain family protein [Coprinopsis cinerea okayama7\|eukprot:XP_001837939.1 Yip1 domain family protein [Coprinopsis cinerea okayama7\
MAYVQVEADDSRLEEGPEGLQFKSFLGADATAENPQRSAGVGNANRDYLADSQNRPKGGGGFWTVEYYQPYFDIDTKTVLQRCYMTMNPLQARTFIPTFLTPADLYGPFWTLTTLILALFLSSSLAASISAYLSSDDKYDYDFKLLSIAVSLVYAYGLALPVLLWLALRYLGVGEWSVVEAISVWGYGQFVWIPVSILCVIPVPIVRWALVGIAFGLSGYFLAANIYPILASAEAKATRLLILLLAAIHLGIAITFKVLFFGYYVVDKIGADIPIPGADLPIGGGNSTKA